MISRLKDAVLNCPRQFWALFFGQLASTSGGSLAWPFMTTYAHEKLDANATTPRTEGGARGPRCPRPVGPDEQTCRDLVALDWELPGLAVVDLSSALGKFAPIYS